MKKMHMIMGLLILVILLQMILLAQRFEMNNPDKQYERSLSRVIKNSCEIKVDIRNESVGTGVYLYDPYILLVDCDINFIITLR